MSDWFKWDDPTPEEREHDRRVDAISNAEGRALALLREISAAADEHPDVASAASAALTHIATIAQAAGQALFQRSLDRPQRVKG